MSIPEAPSAFGALVSASDVESAVQAQLELWLPDYLAEVERYHQLAVGDLPRPRSWVQSSEVEKFPEDHLPAWMVASPGLIRPPDADGSGTYTATWRITVATMCGVRGNRLALRIARLYALANRALLLQQQTLPGLDTHRIDWLDERYDQLPSVDDRTVCISEVELAVSVSGVTSRHQGPLEPIFPPGSHPGPDSPVWPTATSTDIQTELVPLTPDPEPEPPVPAAPLGSWTWRPPGASGGPFFAYSMCTDTDPPTVLAVADSSVEGTDRSAELGAIAVGSEVRVSYPGNEDLPREYEAIYEVTSAVTVPVQPTAQHEIPVALIQTTGDPTHYGEDHLLVLSEEEP